jgi:hypothetical protein
MSENTFSDNENVDTDNLEADEETVADHEQVDNEADGDQVITAYKAAGIVNALLASENSSKQLQPQQLYGYMKRGQLKSITVDGKKRVRLTDLAEWYEKFRSGQFSTSSETTEDLADTVRELLTK